MGPTSGLRVSRAEPGCSCAPKIAVALAVSTLCVERLMPEREMRQLLARMNTDLESVYRRVDSMHSTSILRGAD